MFKEPERQTFTEEIKEFYKPEYYNVDTKYLKCTEKNCANCSYITNWFNIRGEYIGNRFCCLFTCCCPLFIGSCIFFPYYMIKSGIRKIKKNDERKKIQEIRDNLNFRVKETAITYIIIEYIE